MRTEYETPTRLAEDGGRRGLRRNKNIRNAGKDRVICDN